MKSTIIILGLVALTFTTAQAANEFKSQDLDQQESATLNVENTQEQNQLAFVNEENENETTVFSPDSVIKSTYVKTVEDIITENKSITEAQEEITQPLSFETTLEDRITEDNQIIESTVSNELFPLDFDKISNQKGIGTKSIDNLQTAIEASKIQPLHRLIYGLGIRFVGETTAKVLANYVTTIFEFANKSEEDLQLLDDVGVKVAKSIFQYLYYCY